MKLQFVSMLLCQRLCLQFLLNLSLKYLDFLVLFSVHVFPAAAIFLGCISGGNAAATPLGSSAVWTMICCVVIQQAIRS